jgi:hypothetical protein
MKILPRHALHATQLSFTHPELDTRMTFTSALPGDMRAAMELLHCNDRTGEMPV